jgi:predicted membrane protein
MRFLAVCRSQWKWTRLVVAIGAPVAFALPLVSLRAPIPGTGDEIVQASDLLRRVAAWGTLYPLLAAGLGLLVAMSAWAADHRGRHVHALTLPVPRWQFVLYRYGSGLLFLAGPMLALLVGALLAGATVPIPSGLQSYPLSLALRFALAVLTAFSVFFAVSGGTARTAGLILGAIGLLVAFEAAGATFGWGLDLGNVLLQFLLDGAGPFGVFSGRWMLVDV